MTSSIEYFPSAQKDLIRLRDFLMEKLPSEAIKTVGIIMDAIDILEPNPEVGRPVKNGFRELVISRGKSGYLALYKFDPFPDRVRILAIRHQRESGYKNS